MQKLELNKDMASIAVLMTVHNRRDKTLSCLDSLYSEDLPASITMDVYMTDDGCTDGTSDAIHAAFPAVRIIHGDGTLFWNEAGRENRSGCRPV